VLELGLREALGLGHNGVATHHILLGLGLVTATGQEGAADRQVAVLYCDACGRAMGVLPHSASAAG
jgi:hypothetical protein